MKTDTDANVLFHHRDNI